MCQPGAHAWILSSENDNMERKRKANTNMLQVQEELTSTENRVAFSRQAYNDSVLNYNNKREMFPSNLIAGMLNFKFAQSWELDDEAARSVPKVNF